MAASSSSRQKFLMFVSYLGTHYLKNTSKRTLQINHTFVARNLRKTLFDSLGKQAKDISQITLATKTERGVQVAGNALTFELTNLGQKVEPNEIVTKVNDILSYHRFNITISEGTEVPIEFDCQAHAKTREYIYRLVVPKPNVQVPEGDLSLLPISELGRCHYHRDTLNNPFDLDRAAEATKLLVGRHDFASFCSDNHVSKVRTVEEVAINQLELDTHEQFDPNYKNVNIYEFYVRGRSFLFGQIPNMTAAMSSVAFGTTSLNQLSSLINKPCPNKWQEDNKLHLSTSGLYLIGVHYDSEDQTFGKTRPPLPLEDDDFDLNYVPEPVGEEDDEIKSNVS